MQLNLFVESTFNPGDRVLVKRTGKRGVVIDPKVVGRIPMATHTLVQLEAARLPIWVKNEDLKPVRR